MWIAFNYRFSKSLRSRNIHRLIDKISPLIERAKRVNNTIWFIFDVDEEKYSMSKAYKLYKDYNDTIQMSYMEIDSYIQRKFDEYIKQYQIADNYYMKG